MIRGVLLKFVAYESDVTELKTKGGPRAAYGKVVVQGLLHLDKMTVPAYLTLPYFSSTELADFQKMLKEEVPDA